jgi:hypothetical protein
VLLYRGGLPNGCLANNQNRFFSILFKINNTTKLTLYLANKTSKVCISLIPIDNLLTFNISATKTAIVLKELKD